MSAAQHTQRPGESDADYAARLVAAGFYSTSNKYHIVSGWRVPLPRVEDVIRPEMLGAPHVDRMMSMWSRRFRPETDLRGDHPLIENIELTPEQFAMFRRAGGQSA